MLVAVWAMILCAPASAGPTPGPARPGEFYGHFGAGTYRSDGAAFVYGRNPAGTGPAYDYHPPLTGISAALAFGYVLPDTGGQPAWLGKNLRVELAFGYADADWAGSGRTPRLTKVPFLDNRKPNLQITTVPANQDAFFQELRHDSFDLKLATDYRPVWRLTVTPYLGISRIARREISRLTSTDPATGLADLSVSERLDADYRGTQAGVTLFVPLGSGWRVNAGAARSWYSVDAKLEADQAFPTYPSPPGLSMQLGDTVDGKSAQRTMYLVGIGYDSGRSRVDLVVEKSSWSYIPTVVNPMTFTDSAARLDGGHAEDTAFRMMFTVPFGRQ